MALVLLEPFDNLTAWTLTGTPTIVVGRTSTGMTALGTTAWANYAIPGPSQSAVVTIGFAWRTPSLASRVMCSLAATGNTNEQVRMRCEADGSITVRNAGGAIQATSAAGVITAINTWHYIEAQITLGEVPTGAAVVRVNEVEVINATSIDTRAAGTPTVYDAVRLGPLVSGSPGPIWDDLYLKTGAGESFSGDTPVGTCNDVLLEPFENLTNWSTVTGTPTIVAGRNGNAVEMSTAPELRYTIPSPSESYAVVIGFAMYIAPTQVVADFVQFRSDSGATVHGVLRVLSGGALQIRRDVTILGTTAAGALPVSAWAYVEVQFLLHDTAGAMVVKVNGVEADFGGSINKDTRNAGTKSTVDSIQIEGASLATRFDDLYIRTGTLCGFLGDTVVPSTAVVTGVATASLGFSAIATGTVTTPTVIVTGIAAVALELVVTATGTVVPAAGVVTGSAAVLLAFTAHATGTVISVEPPVIPGSGLAEALVEFEDQFGDWVDITCDVRTIDISAGRQQVLEQFRAGTLTLTMANFEGINSAWPPDSIWAQAGPRRTNVPIRVSMVRGGVTHRLFTGTTDAVNDSWPRTVDAMVSVLASDGFKDLARYDDLGQPPARWSDDFEVQESGALEPIEEGWCDEFDRADGPIGSDWAVGVAPTDYDAVSFSIASGAAVGPMDYVTTPSTPPWQRALMYRTSPIGSEDQYIELTVEDLFQNCASQGGGQGHWLELYTHRNTIDAACHALYFYAAHAPCASPCVDCEGTLSFATYSYDASGEVAGEVTGEATISPTTISDSAKTVRLESLADGTQRVLLDGEVMFTAVATPIVGDYVGMSLSWWSNDSANHSPRILEACGGPLEPVEGAWSDDFERADGPVGDDWIVGLETGSGEAPEKLTIVSGAAIGPAAIVGSPDPVGTMSWATPVEYVDQWVEVIFEDWHAAGGSMMIELYNLGGGGTTPDNPPRRAVSFGHGSASGVRVDAYSFDDDGDTTSGPSLVLNPYTGPTTAQTLRLESYASGRQVVSLNGAVIHDYISTDTFSTLGHQQGLWMSWNTGTGRSSPRILSIAGGPL